MKSIVPNFFAGRRVRLDWSRGSVINGFAVFSVFASLYLAVILCLPGAAFGDEMPVIKSSRFLMLGDTSIKVNIYEKPGAQITFFAPHHNEQIGIRVAKEFIEKNGGRLIEIESLNENNQPRRYLFFNVGDKSFQVDPNRIFTANGRACTIPDEIDELTQQFTNNLLQIILSGEGMTLREGEKFLVAIHNNADLSANRGGSNVSDLSAFGYVRGTDSQNIREGAFQDQAEGVYLSNIEPDPDNFIFMTTPKYLGYFAELGFNVVIQKPAIKLFTTNCRIDDGSLSVYSGQNLIPYICLEADADFGAFRQKQMIEAVFELFRRESK